VTVLRPPEIPSARPLPPEPLDGAVDEKIQIRYKLIFSVTFAVSLLLRPGGKASATESWQVSVT
jgi:hypothetical protein